MDSSAQDYLTPTSFFDFNNPNIKNFVESNTEKDATPKKNVLQLYYAVRDSIRYNPYTFSLNPDSLKASYCLHAGQGYCIQKASLLIAVIRTIGIPARLGLADVKNHMATKRFLEIIKNDVFYMHGYVDIFLDDKWVKATPAFDKKTCALLKVPPLDFDGESDSIFQPFNSDGQQFMEYINEHGTFDDVPSDLIFKTIKREYPHMIDKIEKHNNDSFEKDIKDK